MKTLKIPATAVAALFLLGTPSARAGAYDCLGMRGMEEEICEINRKNQQRFDAIDQNLKDLANKLDHLQSSQDDLLDKLNDLQSLIQR